MKRNTNTGAVLSTLALTLTVNLAYAGVTEELELHHENHDHHGAHYAPIGVMASHLHKKGELTASYRYMFMAMQRNYDGDSQVSDAAASNGFMATPTDMDMEMHMLGVMYAPTDKLNLMLMSSYSYNRMTVVNGMTGEATRMSTSGQGDTTLTALYSVHQSGSTSAHVGLGISAPTGDIDAELPNGLHAGFPMQLGSGTWDLKPSITWLGHTDAWSYGGQLSAVVRLGENDQDYTLGNRVSATGWLSHSLNDSSSVSVRLTASDWGNVDGVDEGMPPAMMASTFDPNARGGSRLDLSLGYSLWSNSHGARFGMEVGTPLYQDLDGPQLGVDWTVIAGLQFTW